MEETGEDQVADLAQGIKWASPAVELPQRLHAVRARADQSSESDLSSNVTPLLRSCIAHLKIARGDKKQLQGIVSVISNHGFDEHGNVHYSINAARLQSMIDDLIKLGPNSTDQKINSTQPQRPRTPLLSTWVKKNLFSQTNYAGDPLQYTGQAAFRYIGDVLADKPMMDQKQAQSARDRQQILIDRLRHNLNPFQRSVEAKPKWNQNPSRPYNQRAAASAAQQEAGVCVVEDLLQLMKGSDLAAQVAICRFLLGQRAAAPLAAVMAAQPHEAHSDQLPFRLTHWVQALSFVEVKLLQQVSCYIAEDLALPRVVFISDLQVQSSRAARVASGIVSCNFPSQHMNRRMHTSKFAPFVEVGVGFVDSKPCLAFHVEGPYHDQLMGFVTAIADVIVLEQEKPDGEPRLTFHGSNMVRWSMDVQDGYAQDSNEIWGTEGYLVETIRDYLCSQLMGDHELQTGVMDARRANLKELCVLQFHPEELISFQSMQEILDGFNLTNVRQSLCLQDSYAKEASSFFETLRLNNDPGGRRLMEKQCDKEKRERWEKSSLVARNPLLQVFHMVLCQRDATERRLGLMWLQRYMVEKAQGQRQDLGVVNLWRELCHIFVASPGSQRDLAKLAAQHLLDGFPLEILDGDASMFCQPWVDTVMSELEVLTENELKRPARLLVLSAMGLQSSGKSTILNLMFGAQLMASAGRCTRGVFVQLVPSQQPEFDFVLILDTEGLRSPDFHGNKLANVHDNRLAAFGLLPADASIFMISNEDDGGLKEVLPMVLLGFKGSVMAEQSGGKIRAKMFFVYRSVDTNDKEKLNANKKKLWEHLAEASKEVASMGLTSDAYDDELLLQNMFQDLHVNEDEQLSDVRCMGNLKKGSKPPEDVPDWEYGKQVMLLREHISRRVLEGGRWQSVGIREWTESLARVWKCICKADFELSFKTAVECSAYAKLQETLMIGPRRKVSRQYLEEFDKIEKKIRQSANQQYSDAKAQKLKVTDLFKVLQNGVEPVVSAETNFVKKSLLARSKWKGEEERSWEMFCKKQESLFMSRIKDMCDGVFEYDAAARRYELQMKKEIVALFKNKGLYASAKERDRVFNDLFERILAEAEQSYPPESKNVGKYVTEAYDRTGIAKRVYLPPPSQNSFFKKVGAAVTASVLGNKVKPEQLQKKLQEIMHNFLRDARQYSEVIAESVISEADKLMINARCSKEQMEELHGFVKKELVAAFVEIQTRWDVEHNITAKLTEARDGLRRYFENCANGIGAARMLISELEDLLSAELLERHHDILVRLLSDDLSSSSLVRDWRRLRACLDLHLLTLIEKGKIPQLLAFVANGSEHYKAVTDVLIRVQIEEKYDKQYRKYLGTVVGSLRDAANAAREDRNGSVEFFLETLKRILEDSLHNYEINSSCVPLGQFLFSRVSRAAYEGGSCILDSGFYTASVKDLCEHLNGLGAATRSGLSMEALIGRVRKRMVMGNDDVGPRCTEMCPMCGILCIHAAGHTSKHDTVHQVSGLIGALDTITNELWEWSCYDDIVKKNRFRYNGNWYPAHEFEKVHPDWVNPCGLSESASSSLQLREYIFYKYQDALIAKYPSRKRCPNIPESYKHDFQMLQNRNQNILQSDYKELKTMFAQNLNY